MSGEIFVMFVKWVAILGAMRRSVLDFNHRIIRVNTKGLEGAPLGKVIS